MTLALASTVRRFQSDPAGYAQPERLQGLLPIRLSVEVCRRLAASERLRDRLSALLRDRLGSDPCEIEDFEPMERRLALLDGPGLLRAARLAGAVWHANQFRRVIRSNVVSEIVNRLGGDTYRFAMTNAELAVKNVSKAEAADLVAAIDHDGHLCLGAWHTRLPPAIASRVRLKLPPAIDLDREPTPLHREHGPPIMERVAATLCT